jgi:hypothetical protein
MRVKKCRIKDLPKVEKPRKKLTQWGPEKLKKQFVSLDKNLWKIENYEDFLKHRRRIIVDKINEYLKSLGIEKYI